MDISCEKIQCTKRLNCTIILVRPGRQGHRQRGRHIYCNCGVAYRLARSLPASWNRHHCTPKEHIMGKYFLAWIMGVPAIVLVLIYFFFH
jgi:hypothetical protein